MDQNEIEQQIISKAEEQGRMRRSKFADHDYFVVPKVTDVDKMRDEAYRRSQGDYYSAPGTTVIHHHRLSEECFLAKPEDQRQGQKHDHYSAKKEK